MCQALDRCALHDRSLKLGFYDTFIQDLRSHPSNTNAFDSLREVCWTSFTGRFDGMMSLDSTARIYGAVSQLQSLLLPYLKRSSTDGVEALMNWAQHMSTYGVMLYRVIWKEYIENQNAGLSMG